MHDAGVSKICFKICMPSVSDTQHQLWLQTCVGSIKIMGKNSNIEVQTSGEKSELQKLASHQQRIESQFTIVYIDSKRNFRQNLFLF